VNRREYLERLRIVGGVSVMVDGDKLKVRGPASHVTTKVKTRLSAWKPSLIDEWNERAAILEFDGGFDRAEAERTAAEQIGLAVYDRCVKNV